MADEAEITQEDDRPSWLPENFKSPEDFAKSYQEAQGKLTQTTMRLSEVEETLTAVLEAQQQVQEPPAVQPNQWSPDDLRTAYDNDPIAVTALLVNQGIAQEFAKFQQVQNKQLQPQQHATEEIAAELADNALRARHPDWGNKDEPGYNVKVAELIQRDKTLLPDELVQSPQALASRLEQLYKIAKHDDLVAGVTTAQSQAEADRIAKINSQTVTGVGGRQEATAESDEDFGKSLISNHNKGYAARMGGGGL